MENVPSPKRAGAVLFLEFLPAIVDPEKLSQIVLVQRKVMKSSALELTTLEYAFKRRAFSCDYLIACMLSHDLISYTSVPGYFETHSHCNYFSQNGSRGRCEMKRVIQRIFTPS